MRKAITILAFVLSLAPFAASQTPAAAPPAPSAAPAAAPPPAPVPITDADVKNIPAPSADARAKGDPDGGLTGTVSDITVADAKKGLTIGDIANQIGQNKIAVNFVWTLITGFLVMFMQAGFAIVETGLCRAKNANHTMMMNFMVYGVGMLAYWLIGFAVQFGGYGANANLGGSGVLSKEFSITLFGKSLGLFGQGGYFLTNNHSYDVMVMVLFLFQMVFMDTALTIVTGAAAERWKYAAFIVSSFIMGAFTYPIYGNWAWGGGWLAQLGTNFGVGKGYADFAGSGVVHAVGGITALAVSMIIGPRIGKYTRQGKPLAMPGHDLVIVLTGCFILAFGWFGFNPGSTLGASSNGNLRIGSIAVNTMLAGMAGSFGAMLYMWLRYGKPDASMTGNGLLAGLVAITAPSGFVNTIGGGHPRTDCRRSGLRVGRIYRAGDEGRRSSGRDLGPRNMWIVGCHLSRPVRRRQKQLRRNVERCQRQRYGPVLWRCRPACGAIDRGGDAGRLCLHVQLCRQLDPRRRHRPAGRRKNRVGRLGSSGNGRARLS